MKSIIIKERKLTIDEIPEPIIEKGHILVATVASVISAGTEKSSIQTRSKSIFNLIKTRPDLVAKGKAFLKSEGLLKALKMAHERLNEPSPLGYSSSGVVIEIGENVDEFNEGDKVACAAPHSEISLVPKNLAVKIPEDVSFEEAAFTAIGAIALQGIRRADVRVGDIIAVIGLGLLGLMTIQILRASGATVLALDPMEPRIILSKKFGATYASTHAESIASAIQQLTKGKGVDASIIAASSATSEPLRYAIAVTRKKGKVVIVGAFPIEVERQQFYEKEQDLLISCSIGPGRYDYKYEHDGIDYPYGYVRWTEKRNMEAFLSLIKNKKIDLSDLTRSTFSIEDANQAYESLLNDSKNVSAVIKYVPLEEQQRHSVINLSNRKSEKTKIENKIRVGIIGTGNFARTFHLPNLQKLADMYSIDAVCNHNPNMAKYIAENYKARYCTTDYKEILEDKNIDMVLIATRHDTHAQIAIDAIKANKHIFMEKPAAIALSELNELLETLQSSKIHFMVGFNRRYSPAIIKAKEILDPLPGRITASYHINAGALPENHWVKRITESGGRIVGECIHFVDLLKYIVNSPITDVKSVFPHSSEKYENVCGSILFEDDSMASLIYGNIGSTKGPRELIDIQKGNIFLRIRNFESIEYYRDKKYSINFKPDKGHLNELKLFGLVLKGKESQLVTFEDLYNVHYFTFKLADIIP